jgi:hypothetical protein
MIRDGLRPFGHYDIAVYTLLLSTDDYHFNSYL